jgi:hypothetical protein
MPDMLKAVDAAIEEAGKALTMLGKKKTAQIGKTEEHAYLKAVCLSWLKTHRMDIAPLCDGVALTPIDGVYQGLLEANEGRPSRKHTCDQLKSAKKQLVSLRSKLILVDPSAVNQNDKPPSFAKLAPDPQMQNILVRRWDETIRCIAGNADLAAIVMMGGLLESLLLARINLEQNKKPIYTASKAPKDKKTGQTLTLDEWALKNYIEVTHELGWITKSAQDLGAVLRDWRNYIHPHKEFSHKLNLSPNDVAILWGVAKSIAGQIVASAP